MKVAVILPAAGLGTRMGKGTAERAGTSRKQFMLLDGSPILMHTVRKFVASDRVGVIVIAVRGEDTEWVREMLAVEFESGRVRVVEGGNSRQESVENALRSLGPDYSLVAVHDAVRPFIDLETIHKVFDEAAETGAAIVAVPAVDTVKQVIRGTTHVRIRATLPREKLVMAQTPQVFRYDLRPVTGRRHTQHSGAGPAECHSGYLSHLARLYCKRTDLEIRGHGQGRCLPPRLRHHRQGNRLGSARSRQRRRPPPLGQAREFKTPPRAGETHGFHG